MATELDAYLDELAAERETIEMAMHDGRPLSLRERLTRARLREAAETKVSVSALPYKLAQYLKTLTKKRQVTLQAATEVKVSPPSHAPEFDEFDYSYYHQVDTNTGHVNDLRMGMKPFSDEKRTVALSQNTAIVWGEKNKWARVYMLPDDVAKLTAKPS